MALEKIYNKLVRDKIPEIIENDGEIPIISVLDELDFKKRSEQKLLEEYNEVLLANNKKERLEELADMLEVMVSLCSLEHSNLEEVISIMEEKRRNKGSFSKKFF